MNRYTATLATIAALALATTAQAGPYRFSPGKGDITITGGFVYTVIGSGEISHCPFTFVGHAMNANTTLKITSATVCHKMTASGLPWMLSAASRNAAGGPAVISVNGTTCSTSNLSFSLQHHMLHWHGSFGAEPCALELGPATATPDLSIRDTAN